MKKYWQAIGITVAAAAILYYPAMKLYKYVAKRRAEALENEEPEEAHIKAFAPAYRGKHKPHHRHTHNGHAGPDMA